MGLADKPCVVIPVQIFSIIVAIVSISLVWSAYNELNAAINDVSDMLNNWETKPLVQVAVVDYQDSCPSGFEEMPNRDWPGASAGNCACPSTSGEYTSTTASCSTNQTQAGCITDPAISSISLSVWRGKKTCYRRGGEPAMTWTDSFWERPHPDSETGECESGYKKCGDGTFDESRSICFPDDELCPITDITVASSEPSDFSTADISNVTAEYGDGTAIFFKRQSFGQLPLVDLSLQLAGSNRGPCYQGSSQTYSTASSASDGQNSYASTCIDQDTRYEAFDTYDEADFLYENFALSDRCEGVAMADLKETDYRSGGAACSGDDCEVSVSDTFSCRSTDSVCKNVIYQTKCGKIMHFANQAEASWARYARSQIYWREDCAVEEDSIKTQSNPLRSAGNAQLALGICNTISNIVVGVIIPIMVLQQLKSGDLKCLPGSGESEKKLLKALKTWIGHSFRLIKFIPLIIAIAIIGTIRTYFDVIGSVECSDDLTNSTFAYLADKLPSVMNKNYATLGLDIFQILISIALLLKGWCCKQEGSVQPESKD
mmetsp:Transcript_22844/g.29636  ORF Transcript_22844/g.29636 Transcript_22844/m.29636 type:complete len:545 (+) Transcript_22844:186-1820(+)|eukprot:CAMPEP_0117737730 /NCGR_PEP_ID=MMETSP0947-20121206/2705_1 /TAXON_ID=44440 /ORGANISM="Chattonella subsalsa, Strain CCMP2191" /LENGTH=544 /DNA_ID=CAMNT_0005553279 /DNA_START=117 /DNA_END=1751 /DNA_ORIENTATION=+